jgi:hypothetical protein
MSTKLSDIRLRTITLALGYAVFSALDLDPDLPGQFRSLSPDRVRELTPCTPSGHGVPG